MTEPAWWRDAVVHQIYPRSFQDTGRDGEGDLAGVTRRLDHLVALGVDALWLCPFYPSPMVDGGYDVADHTAVDPRYGTLADLDELVAQAHARGLRVTIDLVPNHVSSASDWFVAGLAAGRGSPERSRFLFREGRGPGGDEPPTNWTSVFGGPSWTRVTEPDGSPGQWYYHLFAAEQPDLDWSHPDVSAEFERILRFWLDRGIDGFRIDVSDALVKDLGAGDTADGAPVIPKDDASGVHEIYRDVRRVLDDYDGDRMAVVETGAAPDVVALFLRPDEMHLAFSFELARAAWDARELRSAVDAVLAANAIVGAPATWVTDNHDTPRSVTRYARAGAGGLRGAYVPTGGDGELLTAQDVARGTARARAAAVLLLTLPGAAFVYQGQELGLPEVEDLPPEALQDPAVARSGGTVRGRDGCRVPLPWEGDAPPYGFTEADAGWLPQPTGWGELAVAHQERDEGSMLRHYRALLALRRREVAARRGALEWLPAPDGVLAYRRTAAGGEPLVVMINLGADAVPVPDGEVLLATGPLVGDGERLVPGDGAVVVRPVDA
ncbi:alpha-amylase [Serinibacter arcticus]|uniref:Alpha-amylase n=1 Tax=Serinibacter arcticus TaxID=1655435 RepID=A0A2U1ZU86_9MICO|nr:glycoside hydrolase family 13 protein [Serinibacter arcticus]PWD50531.1 alpha-amylase [Serinibacter arcticus]